MPFGHNDPHGKAFAKFKQERVSVIVLLAEDAEYLQKAKRHLRDLYAREGFQVIYLPIPVQSPSEPSSSISTSAFQSVSV